MSCRGGPHVACFGGHRPIIMTRLFQKLFSILFALVALGFSSSVLANTTCADWRVWVPGINCTEADYAGFTIARAACNGVTCSADGTAGQTSMCQYGSGNTMKLCHFIIYSTACPAGQVNNGSGLCITPVTCLPPQHRDEATNTCVNDPPPTCATGQHVNTQTNMCVADTPAPVDGQAASTVGITSGTQDASGNFTWGGDAAGLISMSKIYNCGGWQCRVSAEDYDFSAECTVPIGGGTVVCPYIPHYTGELAVVADPVSSPVATGETYAPPSTAGCPAGYYFESPTGLCVSGATAGTASTPTTPGTAPDPGIAACPSGFTLGTDGKCTGGPVQQANGSFACPSGYTANASGVCTSNSPATIGSGSVPSSGVGSGAAPCGGLGQAACSVTIAGPADYAAIISADADTASKGQADGFVQGVLDKMASWSTLDPAKGNQNSFVDSYTAWFDAIPSSGCSAMSSTVGSYTWNWNPCPTAEKISTIGGYAMWIYFAVGVFVMVTGGRKA